MVGGHEVGVAHAEPGESAVAVAVVLGVIAVVWGAVFIALGLLLRRRSAEVAELDAAV